MEPASSGWLDTVKRTLNLLAYCFVWPHVTEEQWAMAGVVSAFTQKLISGMRRNRKARPARAEKNLSAHAKQWGVHKAAIHQTLHHTEDVRNQVYLAGIRNEANELQAWLLSW